MTPENIGQKPPSSDAQASWWKSICYEYLGAAGEKLAETLFGCEVKPESRDNLQSFGAHLADGSGVVYLNHIGLLDGPIIAFFLARELSEKDGSLKILGGPVSRKHYDFARSPWALVLHLAPLMGLEVAPVVQEYDFNSYPRTERRALLLRYRDKVIQILQHPGGVWMIAPEETRSPTGTLQRAKQGLAYLHKYAENVSFLPLAIIPKDSFNRDLGLGKIEIAIGKPYTMEELVNEGIPEGAHVVDAMMEKLSFLLPKSMHGYYAR